MEEITLSKEVHFSSFSGLMETKILDAKLAFASGLIGLSKAEIFRKYLVEFETRFRYFIGEENYISELVDLFRLAGIDITKNMVMVYLSNTAKELNFDRDKKKFKRVRS